jgi:ATP-dependent helicase/nuclease subunit A
MERVRLTPSQWEAVRRTGQDVCVIAGPGAGKTRVLIERFAWLVEEQGGDPNRILAITFTEKAATEIKARLIARFAGTPELREAIERAWVSTIDGFCARLLKEHAIAAGIAPDFAVLDQPVAERLKRDAAEEALDGLFEEHPVAMRRLLEALDLSTQDDGPQPDLARSLLTVYDTMRVSGVSELPAPGAPRDFWSDACHLARDILDDRARGGAHTACLREWCVQFLALSRAPLTRSHFKLAAAFDINLGRLGKNRSRTAADDLKRRVLPGLQAQWLAEWNADLAGLLRSAIGRIDAAYRAAKRRDASLDFADLEEQATRLLESDAVVRRETADRFDQILMDELQDTNRLQWRLVDLVRRNFFAVGDINQSIYGFRHAEPSIFEDYRSAVETEGGAVDDLRENHRSRPEILETVSRMLDGQPGIEARPLIAARPFEPAQGLVVQRLVGQGDNGAEVEAGLVAARIRELVDSGAYTYRDIGVLVRTLASMGAFESAFDRFGIPFLVSGGRTFLEAREIRDLLALLAALVNPLDEIALVGVLRGPLVGLSDEQVFKAGSQGWRQEFEARFGRLRRLAGFVGPDRLLATALDESGYAAGLPERARANIGKLLSMIRREHATRQRPLAELLDDLESLRATQSEAEAPPPAAGDTVRLTTIHAAKGLEFPVVFVSALHRGPDRRRPVIWFSSTGGLGVKWRNPATGKGQSDTAHLALIEELRCKEEAEENRLLYVAMTRAEERLILSYAERGRPSNWQKLAEGSIPEATIADTEPEPPQPMAHVAAPSREEFVDPPVLTNQHDSTAAVTSVALFDACPRKYYLERYLGLEPAYNGLATGGLSLGLEVHALLAGGISDSPDAGALAQRFTASELGQRAARATRLEREFDFLLHLEGIVLRGQIDLWFEESDELVLVDYKTDLDESPSDQYALQLRLYALALERYAGRLPNRAVLYYLRSDRSVDVSLAPPELGAVRVAVRAFARAQDSMDFSLRVGEHCWRCAFFQNLCPAMVQTRAPQSFAPALSRAGSSHPRE